MRSSQRIKSTRIRLVSSFVLAACLWTANASSQWSENSSRRPGAVAGASFQNPADRREQPNGGRPPPPPQRDDNVDNRSWDAGGDDRRPPPPPTRPDAARPSEPRPPFEPSSTTKTPIHYQFRSRQETADGPKRGRGRGQLSDDVDNFPQTFSDEPSASASADDDNNDVSSESPKFASARRDPITRYMATKRGRALLTLSSGTVGASLGGFIGKSTLDAPYSFAATFCFFFVICTFFRSAYGELVKALGLALIFALQRTSRIRRRYPTFPKIKAAIGAAQRVPFPPAENPWSYQPEDDELYFSMMYATIAMGFVGSICGGNLPLVPTWMGALGGAGSFAFLTTTRDSRGDLCRTMGMRVVSLGQEVLGINQELRLLNKLGVVTGKVFDKMMILDSKHRIKDRLVSGFSWAYEKVSRTASQVQSDMQGGPDEPRDRRREPDDRRDGPDRDVRRGPHDGRDRDDRRRGPPNDRDNGPAPQEAKRR